MALSSDIVKSFAKMAAAVPESNEPSFIFGTAKKVGGEYFVRFDGSELYTPVMSTIDISDDDRVMVMIQNHTGTITSNVTSPAVSNKSFSDYKETVAGSFDHIYATYITAQEIEAEYIKTALLDAEVAKVGYLKTNQLDAEVAKLGYLTASEADIGYAKIDLTNIGTGAIKQGMIDTGAIGTAQIAKGAITDAKIESLTATKIKGGTLDASQITVANLNVDTMTVGTINGSRIASGTVDHDRLSAELSAMVDNSVSDVTIYYCLWNSPTTAPADNYSEWNTRAPNWQADKYMWQKTVTIFSDHTQEKPHTTTTKTCIQGAKGQDGERGTTWFAGTGVYGTAKDTGEDGNVFPDSGVSSAILGDHYLNTTYQNVYICSFPGNAATAKWKYEQNIKGTDGTPGVPGADGKSEYLHIKYSNDGLNFTGHDGEDPGDYIGTYTSNDSGDSMTFDDYTWAKIKGTPGQDGVSPTISTSKDSGVTTITIVDAKGTKTAKVNDGTNGTNGKDGKDGTSVTVEETRYKEGTSATIPPSGEWPSKDPVEVAEGNYLWTRVLYSDGSKAFSVAKQGKSGTNGKDGTNGTNGKDGKDGLDGYSPTVIAVKDGTTTTITVTNKTGTSTATINDGKDGTDGKDGKDGQRGATWYAGTAIDGDPEDEASTYNTGIASAIAGDRYLNTDNQNVYICTLGGNASTALWIYEQNIKGEQGAPGGAGKDGKSAYVHIKYSNDNGKSFTGNQGEDPGSYIGTYTDDEETDKLVLSLYKWAKIEGPKGDAPKVTNQTYAWQLSYNGDTVPTGDWSPTELYPTVLQYVWTMTSTFWDNGDVTYSYIVGGRSGTDGEGMIGLNRALQTGAAITKTNMSMGSVGYLEFPAYKLDSKLNEMELRTTDYLTLSFDYVIDGVEDDGTASIQAGFDSEPGFVFASKSIGKSYILDSDGEVILDSTGGQIWDNGAGLTGHYVSTIAVTDAIRNSVSKRLKFRVYDAPHASIVITKCKLEIGDTETPWCLAYLDLTEAMDNARNSADGKNKVFYQDSEPSAIDRKLNDIWFDTDDGNAMYYWDGSNWRKKEFGGDAIEADSIMARHIVAGAITAAAIEAGAITTEKIAADAITADLIAANSITADHLNGKIITADYLATDSVTADAILAGEITGEKLNIADIVANSALIQEIFATDITATNTITGGTFIGGSLQSIGYEAASSGNYSKTGMIIDLAAGCIKTPKFAVTTAGKLYATDGEFSGKITTGSGSKIGGWTLTDHDMSATVTTSTGSNYVFFGDGTTSGSGNQNLHAMLIKTVNNGTEAYPFFVRNTGYLHATDADIRGAIQATSLTVKEGLIFYDSNFSTTMTAIGGRANRLELGATVSNGTVTQIGNGANLYGNLILYDNAKETRIAMPPRQSSWINAISEAAIDIWSSTDTTSFNSFGGIWTKDGKWAFGPLNSDSSFNLVYATATRLANMENGFDTGYRFGNDGTFSSGAVSTGSVTASGAISANTVTSNAKGGLKGMPSDDTGALREAVLTGTGAARISRFWHGANTTASIHSYRGNSWSTYTFSVASSDKRLKENVKDAEVKQAMDLVSQIKMRSFDWKDDKKHQKIGFIADELEELDPNLAVGGGEDENGNMNVKAVDTFYLLGYLVKALQEANDRIKVLERRIGNE